MFDDLREEPIDNCINQIENELEIIIESGICVIGNIIDLSSNQFESSVSYIPISVNKKRRCAMHKNKSEVLTFESSSRKERVLKKLPIDYPDSAIRARLEKLIEETADASRSSSDFFPYAFLFPFPSWLSARLQVLSLADGQCPISPRQKHLL